MPNQVTWNRTDRDRFAANWPNCDVPPYGVAEFDSHGDLVDISLPCHECQPGGGLSQFLDYLRERNTTAKVVCVDCETGTYNPTTVLVNGEDITLCVNCLVDYSELYDGSYALSEDCESCEGCNDIYRLDDMYESGSGHICEGCSDREYRIPADDNIYYHVDSLNWCDYCDAWFVEQHYCENAPGGLLDFSADVLSIRGPYAIVKGKPMRLSKCKDLVLGVELETDMRSGCYPEDVVDDLRNVPGFEDYAICKSDATCTGPEFVTVPADLYSHQNKFLWARWCEAMLDKAKGFYGSDNGMHIHMNRSALSPLVLGKMLVFLNSGRSREFLSMIAQRPIREAGWAKIKPHIYNGVGKSGKNPNADFDKYSILNVNGKGTAELRMFKSTLVPERIYKNLEFCDALVNWCRQESAKNLTVDSFQRFIRRNAKTYMHLHTFIENRSEE